jgi:hypothetical protein
MYDWRNTIPKDGIELFTPKILLNVFQYNKFDNFLLLLLKALIIC